MQGGAIQAAHLPKAVATTYWIDVNLGSVFVLVFMMFMFAVVVIVTIISHAIANRTACRATQAGTHGATCRPTDTVAYDLTARGAQAATDGCLGLLPILGAHRATGSTTMLRV